MSGDNSAGTPGFPYGFEANFGFSPGPTPSPLNDVVDGYFNPKQMHVAPNQLSCSQPASHTFPTVNRKRSLHRNTPLLPNVMTGYSANAREHHGQVTPPSSREPRSAPHIKHETDGLSAFDGIPDLRGGDGDGSADRQAEDSIELVDTNTKKRKVPRADDVGPVPPPAKRGRKRGKAWKPKQDAEQEEPQNEEEIEKREKFLERNRVAASKCRQKKKQWTNGLEERARRLTAERSMMTGLYKSLTDEYLDLKTRLLSHVGCDSKIEEYVRRTAESLAPQQGLFQHNSLSGFSTVLGRLTSSFQEGTFDAKFSSENSQNAASFGPVSTMAQQQMMQQPMHQQQLPFGNGSMGNPAPQDFGQQQRYPQFNTHTMAPNYHPMSATASPTQQRHPGPSFGSQGQQLASPISSNPMSRDPSNGSGVDRTHRDWNSSPQQQTIFFNTNPETMKSPSTAQPSRAQSQVPPSQIRPREDSAAGGMPFTSEEDMMELLLNNVAE